jgi:hypothetical protein
MPFGQEPTLSENEPTLLLLATFGEPFSISYHPSHALPYERAVYD